MRETDPNKMSNTEWERWAADRIAELEEIIERMCHADAVVITANEERLEAENARLREAQAGFLHVDDLRNAMVETAAENQRLREQVASLTHNIPTDIPLLGGGDE